MYQIQQDLYVGRRRKYELGANISIPLKSDNLGSIALEYNPGFHSRIKYTDIQYHYIRDKVATQKILLSYIPTDRMIANGLIKALTHIKFHYFMEQMIMQ